MSARRHQARRARARVAPRAQALRGDRAWRERLQRCERDDTLIVELTAWVLVDGGAAVARSERACCYRREAVWIDRTTSLPVLSERLRAVVLRAFVTVAPGLPDRGTGLAGGDKEVAVELDIDRAVIAALTARLGVDGGLRSSRYQDSR